MLTEVNKELNELLTGKIIEKNPTKHGSGNVDEVPNTSLFAKAVEVLLQNNPNYLAK